MNGRILGDKISSFQIIILGFVALIFTGMILLMLPVATNTGVYTSWENALFTSTSAVCVTGLVVKDTASYWSPFGQTVILILIQIGGLGVVSVAAFIASVSGRKISLLQRSMLQDTISAHQIGGIVKMTRFIFKTVFITELSGALILLPTFWKHYGVSGIWMSVFHSVSAFCNAGFDIMGTRTGAFSSLTSFRNQAGIVIPIGLLIIIGGIGFLTWQDIAVNRFHLKRYRMQSKVVLVTTVLLIILPTTFMFFHEYTGHPMKERFFLALFQSVTPRTAGFNTGNLSLLSGTGRCLLIFLMLIGGSPGSTAGGMKTTTVAVLSANSVAVFRRKKHARLFGRRVEDSIVKTASALLTIYLLLTLAGAAVISMADHLPLGVCFFETASAIGTVGLSLGITPDLSLVSHLILILLMFFGRAGGLTLMYATILNKETEVSQVPYERINVG